jgi:RiboL-PSP-HEPN
VTSLRQKLEELALLVEDPQGQHVPHDASDWLARFLVVRSCGYLEQTIAEVVHAYLRGRSGGPVRAFATSWMERSRNPTPEALLVLTGRFDSVWSSDLQTFLEADDQRLAREISFLVDRRNRIAHGLSEGVGGRKALGLKDVACEVADWFIARFNPGR